MLQSPLVLSEGGVILFAINIEVRSQVLGYLYGQKSLRGISTAQGVYRPRGNRWWGENNSRLTADFVGCGRQPGGVKESRVIRRFAVRLQNCLALHRQTDALGKAVSPGRIRIIESIRASGLELRISELEGMCSGYIGCGEVFVYVLEGLHNERCARRSRVGEVSGAIHHGKARRRGSPLLHRP